MFFKKFRYKCYQKWFCEQFIKRSVQLEGYNYYLRHYFKKGYIHSSFCEVAIYDVLDNDGINKLIKSIYKLNKKEYEVDTPYIYHKLKKDNYINSNLIGQKTGIIADVKFNNNKWLSKI